MTDVAALDSLIDEFVAHWNSRIGEKKTTSTKRATHRDYPIWYRHITPDLIRIFATANGDTNPLYRDEEYAKRSVWGRLIGHPMTILAVTSVTSLPDGPEVPGWNYYQAGTHYVMERPLLPGDVVDAEDVWHGITEHTKPDRPHRTFIMHGERRFTNQHGHYLGKLVGGVFATAPKTGTTTQETTPSDSVRSRRRYTDAELDAVYAHYDDEIAGKLRRGDEPRYWEDVNVGDDVGTVLKGPSDVLDLISFGGVAGGAQGFADKWALIKHEAEHSPRDHETGAYHYNMAWHYDDVVAQDMAQPFAIGFGSCIETSFAQAAMNWAGDHAFLREIANRIPAPAYMGDMYRITGRVSRTYEEDGRGLVEIELTDVSQDDVVCGRSRCVVQLPHRGRPNEVVEQALTI